MGISKIYCYAYYFPVGESALIYTNAKCFYLFLWSVKIIWIAQFLAPDSYAFKMKFSILNKEDLELRMSLWLFQMQFMCSSFGKFLKAGDLKVQLKSLGKYIKLPVVIVNVICDIAWNITD